MSAGRRKRVFETFSSRFTRPLLAARRRVEENRFPSCVAVRRAASRCNNWENYRDAAMNKIGTKETKYFLAISAGSRVGLE